MAVPTKHPRLAAVACAVYSLTTWLYPSEFRHAFGRELVITFQSQVNDVLNNGTVLGWLIFVVRTTLDVARASVAQLVESIMCKAPMRGCAAGNEAGVFRNQRAVQGALAFVSGAGVSCLGCYGFILLLLSYAR